MNLRQDTVIPFLARIPSDARQKMYQETLAVDKRQQDGQRKGLAQSVRPSHPDGESQRHSLTNADIQTTGLTSPS